MFLHLVFQVLQQLLQRHETDVALPTDNETTLLLNTKFSLRLDLAMDSRKIEEGFVIPDNDNCPTQDEDGSSMAKKMKTD